jgi:hypothetical protein
LDGGFGVSNAARLLGRLRFRHLLLLVALDEHRNLHRAGRLWRSPARMVSCRIWSCCSGRRCSIDCLGGQPTEVGAVVVAFARRALGDLRRVSAEVDGRLEGRGRILAIPNSSYLESLANHFPVVQVDMTTG